ncbi:MAG: hypothetical protein D6727_03635 [Gammaproteobacteria bacterium]|nr:MAG: hypothetical protein D6727_03635 [Gammaproteobacteria bacterium]
MPTESAFLFAGLLFLAAALGYLFAWFGERDRDDEPRAAPVSRDYLKGLHYLVDEDADRALEVFARMAESDEDTLEIHFALGSLFRKRGEVDRAIRIHQNVMARPGLDRLQKGQAQLALAEDYLSAGLLDRAEKLYSQLRDYPEFRERALKRLLGILERTQDWEAAIKTHEELARLTDRRDEVGRLAHYYCELAEQALAAADWPRARQLLRKAAAARPRSVRSLLVRADLAREAGDWRDARKLYRRAADEAPWLISEILPRVARLYQDRDDADGFSRWLDRLLAAHPDAGDDVALAVIADEAVAVPEAMAQLSRFIAADPILAMLVDAASLAQRPADERTAALQRIRGALARLRARGVAYRCRNCGYGSLSLQWQCPGCRQWESLRPEFRLGPDAGG